MGLSRCKSIRRSPKTSLGTFKTRTADIFRYADPHNRLFFLLQHPTIISALFFPTVIATLLVIMWFLTFWYFVYHGGWKAVLRVRLLSGKRSCLSKIQIIHILFSFSGKLFRFQRERSSSLCWVYVARPRLRLLDASFLFPRSIWLESILSCTILGCTLTAHRVPCCSLELAAKSPLRMSS